MMRLKQDSVGHARLIESAVQGQIDGIEVDQAVRHSWGRCLATYSLDPLQLKKPLIVERSDLQARRERIGAVLPIARIEMLALSRQMQHSQFGIMLTDADGVILSYVGDAAFSDTARRSGFREGAIWSERELGTNGMGTCLITRRPIIIHCSEHFLVQNTELTCSAAPIFDMHGRVIAALDISGAATKAQAHTLALVDIAAQNIENRALLQACKASYHMRFHSCAEFVSTTGEGVLAFDERGAILGANRQALQLLGYRDHQSLCTQALEAVFDTTPAALMQWAARPAFRPEALIARLGHLRMYAVVQAPVVEKTKSGSTAIATALDPLDKLQTGDPVIANNVRIARRVLNRDISVLLLGETGTGKGFFAKAIHSASERADKAFVSVNCAAIPELLIESELFGYKPGAFTGATREGHSGRILQANGGTLFLDEIGDMPLSLQARLLSVIEDREVMPLGGNKPVAVDIRVISATHRDPVEMISKGLFRDDLYYRLNGITLTMPPLRQRQDVVEVIQRLLRAEAGERDPVQIDRSLLDRLLRHPWPGNLRQLRNVVRNMLALRESEILTADEFDDRWLLGGVAPSAAAAELTEAVECDDVLGSAEREALCRTLEACNWNVSVAAVRLHLSRKTMYRKMHRYGVVRQPLSGPRATAGSKPLSLLPADAAGIDSDTDFPGIERSPG